MTIKPSKRLSVGLIVLIGLIGFTVFRSGVLTKPQTETPQAVDVKVVQVVQRDTPITYEFVGKVSSKNEIKIMSKVSGNIVAKMVEGGDTVYQGQPLFQIDNKQYRSAVNAAAATLAKSQATLRNTQRDVDRYKKLAAIQGVSQQTLDSYIAQAEEEAATVAANEASLQQAREDEQDTLIVAPVDGRLDINDLSLGYYVTAGSTTLATVSSLDPIWVQFTMSENEYLNLVQAGNGTMPEAFKNNLKLVLSNGTEYSLRGQIEQIDKGMSDTTGTITMKASFSNPQKMLIPGMFAKIVATGEVRKGALSIPQRAVKELLDSTIVTLVKEDNTAENRAVTMGEKVGNTWIVESGLNVGDKVVVDGIDKVQQGTTLNVVIVQADDLPASTQQ
ncbi:MAG TPA: efflux RND transporter periplasmic adaptor subunit [Methylomusa anaerophila]|uniref:Multidrug export protein AcrE n=1 Tax=Methylomusa anaerophila TaxID=1930071 RepID=A0A348AEJ6_9FIRM|nr:efflux RND transporter periplasmic adaptor subunit [Methylomusa anaerophila]BBB89494.1 multidrug export protein AcrE precursor [Methylomusa anaerophila]HML89725.1 efflux RND transporter periplasmic adaptor subunit [Methylomusa anaerophila]